MSEQQKPRVLVYVNGGSADYAADKGVDVFVFDRDDYNDDPKNYGGAPVGWEDLARQFRVPVEKPFVMKSEWNAAIQEMRDAGCAVVLFNPDEVGRDVDARRLESSLVERGNYLIK